MLDFASLYSERARSMEASEIRELLKVVAQPGMISFAGGIPNPETFPVEDILEIIEDLLKCGDTAPLQYGTTEGHLPLREALVELMSKWGVDSSPDETLITSGSQQGLNLISEIMLDAGDRVEVEEPSYLGGLVAFKDFLAVLDSTVVDSDGLRVDIFEDKLESGLRPKFIYVIPNFQNPSGVTLSEKRRKKLVDLAHDYGFLIVEDDPYRELMFEGRRKKPLKAYDDDGYVLYLSSFSKILAPGFRIGWAMGDKDLIRKMVVCRQSNDLCASTLGSFVATEYLNRGCLPRQIKVIKGIYTRKRDLMLSAIRQYFPKEVRYNEPHGGMFFWATMPEHVDAKDVLDACLKDRVAFVTGRAFHAHGTGKNTMRLSFSNPPDEDFDPGVRILSKNIAKFL